MAELITLGKLRDAGVDVGTLGEFANEDRTVISRLGLEYPSAPMASRLTVENGLLGATPFSFYNQMTSSELAVGKYAVVTEDSEDVNGVYFKGVDGWVFSRYNMKHVAENIIRNKTYDTTGLDVFAFSDESGKIGVTIDSGANINASNINSNLSHPYLFAFLDDDNKIALAIDKFGDIHSPTIDAIRTEIDSIIERMTSLVGINYINPIKMEKSDYMHVFSYGQSLSRGALSSPIISATQPYSNVTFASGVLPRSDETHDYSSFKPLIEQTVGQDSESPTSSTLNNFVKRRVAAAENESKWVMVGTAPGKGGMPIGSLSKGLPLYDGLISQVQAAYDIAQSQKKSYNVFSMLWTQGENDYSVNRTFKAYYNLMIKLYQDFAADVKAITNQGFSPPMISYQTAAHRRYESETMQVALAQLQASKDEAGIILATPIYHLDTASDNLHLTADASYQLGQYYAKVMDYTYTTGQKWQPLMPISIQKQGLLLDIVFNKHGLVFDTSIVAPADNYGFDIWQGSVLLNVIDGVYIVDSNRLKVLLKTEIPHGAIISYAKARNGDPISSGNIDGARGNLRDNDGSDDNYTDSNGNLRYLHNWCVMFEQSI